MVDTTTPVVLVTGAGKGAGRKVSEAFASQGAQVALNDISPINLDEMLTSWKPRGFRTKAYVEDVGKKLSAQALINQVLDDWGRIDVLVNHAQVVPRKPLLEMDEWDWHRTLEVNLGGTFLMTQSVGRVMRQQGGGVIINMVSLAGPSGFLDCSAYMAAQMGVLGFTMQAAHELSAHGIRVHAVGRGLAAFQNAPVEIPRETGSAVLFLAGPLGAGLKGIIMDIPPDPPR